MLITRTSLYPLPKYRQRNPGSPSYHPTRELQTPAQAGSSALHHSPWGSSTHTSSIRGFHKTAHETSDKCHHVTEDMFLPYIITLPDTARTEKRKESTWIQPSKELSLGARAFLHRLYDGPWVEKEGLWFQKGLGEEPPCVGQHRYRGKQPLTPEYPER